MFASRTPGSRLALRVLAAWLPMAVLWTLIALSAGESGLLDAARFGFVSIGAAALLGMGVWRLTARWQWPDRVGVEFYVRHAAAGALFAGSWMVMVVGTIQLSVGMPLLPWPLDAFLTVWRFLMGLLLYGLVAGVAYALRIREQLRRQERATLEARTLAAEARLDSLRAQLDPHFLFNALHSVSELMHEDVASAERALEGLASLLRTSLEGDADLVPLAAEWDFVQRYLEIERLRLGERLRVESHLTPEALEVPVPSFTLQVLVENAVRHAVAPRPEGGRIEVVAEVEGGKLRLRVVDDGPGLDADPAAREGGGRGLRLLRQRLEAAYGSEAVLVAGPGAVNPGARMRVELPAP